MKPVAVKLTPAMRRALHAVNNGHIIRVYTKDGNVFRARGDGIIVSYRLLWVLLKLRLIEGGEHIGGIEPTTIMKLSDAGRAALDKTRIAPGNVDIPG